LSLVRQAAYRIGREAAKLLIDCLGGHKPSRHIVMEAELVERDGVRADRSLPEEIPAK
jgi:DNA-binding LacI/PurR family transcriptional regulator